MLEHEQIQASESISISKKVLEEIEPKNDDNGSSMALHSRVLELAKNIKKESHYINITPNNLTQLSITN